MLIFAHRGASGIEPENTLRAIRTALDANVDGIEIDIHQVEDKLVVIHDRWLHRTTSGNGQIKHYSFEQLRALDAGKGEVIPTLDEVLELTANKCLVNIELKGINDIQVLFNCLDNAKATHGFEHQQLLISSYNHRLLHLIKQQRSELTIGALTSCYPLEYAKFAEKLDAYSVHLDVDFISEHFVSDAHQRGLKVFVYTVDELDDIKALKAMGVDGIFSNFPTRTKAHIAHLIDNGAS
ncbi:glycerophosphodiester phosphodiesterase [Litorilituus sediminis]|uniref:Glycerophosphodiester phosphodiesterase n=1 Tax=Litorilituus sediminis TaxID=718192 RepID=A0A4P6P8G3_9GAMM|nr:glycerophosphodiester phosphodiesterase family protein [Litorilituus sediminis]QBG35795.1 glycerophosphodiester phosphodiesterase [Litorilituus sediminis]